jgi:hypothetical protein
MTEHNHVLPGHLATTAMAVMPHTDVDRALEYVHPDGERTVERDFEITGRLSRRLRARGGF